MVVEVWALVDDHAPVSPASQSASAISVTSFGPLPPPHPTLLLRETLGRNLFISCSSLLRREDLGGGDEDEEGDEEEEEEETVNCDALSLAFQVVLLPSAKTLSNCRNCVIIKSFRSVM